MPTISATLGLENMQQRAKNWLALCGGGAISLGILGILVLVVWLRDIRDDRKHFVIVNAVTPVFVGTGDEGGCHPSSTVATVERGIRLPVKRIAYQKDCATLDVVLPDGRRGYVVLGMGDVSVNPPLPNI